MQRFEPDLDVYPWNFAVEQGPSGWVYVGNAEGLLSFDGTRWRLHPVPGDGVVRTLANDGQGRLYVGGYDAFGYFETPITADAEFVDLTSRFGLESPDFSEIWQVEVTPEGVFFVALNDVFRFDPERGETRHWHHPGRFGPLGRIDDRVYLQYRGEGLRVLADDEFVADGIESIGGQLYRMLPLPDGGVLATARDGRWRVLRDRRVMEYEMPEAMPASNQIAGAEVLASGLLVFGTVDGRVLFFDPVSMHLESVQLANEWIVDVAPSAEGGIIAQTDFETLYVRWPAEWTGWSADHGLLGNVNEVLFWQDRWIVVSNSGVFASAPDRGLAFRDLPWTDFEAWDFQPLGDGTGLLADSYGIRHVDADGALKSLAGIQYPRLIEASRRHAGIYFVGTEDGLAIVRYRDGRFDSVQAPTLTDSGGVFSILETGPREIVVGTLEQGVQRVDLDAGFGVLSATRIDAGVEYADIASVDVVELGGVLHALTASAAWRWNGASFEPAAIPGLDAIWTDERVLMLTEDPSGGLWAWDFDSVWRQSADGVWQEQNVGALLRGAITAIDFDAAGRALIGASASVAIFESVAPALATRSFAPGLNEVRLTGPDGKGRALNPSVRHELPAQPMALRFDYSLPGLSDREEIEYRARLEGYEPRFTDWEKTTRYTYIDLEPGSYRFLVEARARDGGVRAVSPFEFDVVPPWYRSSWFVGLRWPATVLALALLIWVYLRARVSRLESERRRLARQVAERTRELESVNRELKRMAEVDELTGIANRRSLDRYLREALSKRSDGETALAVALIDLDRFKPYNDEHGHLAGDRILEQVARCLVDCFDVEGALVARFGGDEFGVVLPGVEAAEARSLAEVARTHCARQCEPVEMSIGIAAVEDATPVTAAEMIEAADHQLYRIKRSGRNAVRAVRYPAAVDSESEA